MKEKVVIRKAHSVRRMAYNNYSLCAMLYALCILMLGCAQTKMGCAQVKDYLGVHHGKLNVGIKQNFGQGEDKKNYYVINKDSVIAVGDSYEEVIKNAGYPDKVERSLEGYDVWIYSQKKIKLFFDKERLKEWRIS